MNSEQTRLDKFLDDALRNYSDAEPRIGLESRILANLRTAPAHPKWYAKPVFALAVIAVLCTAGYRIWRIAALSHRTTQPAPTIMARFPAPDVSRTNNHTVTTGPTHKPVLRHAQRHGIPHEGRRAILASQLPLPRPLSAQEKLLLALARENPKEVLSTVAWQEQMRQRPKNPDLPDQGEQ